MEVRFKTTRVYFFLRPVPSIVLGFIYVPLKITGKEADARTREISGVTELKGFELSFLLLFWDLKIVKVFTDKLCIGEDEF